MMKDNSQMTSLDFFNGDELAASVFDLKYKMDNEKNPHDRFKTIVKEIAEKEFIRINNKDIQNKFESLSDYGKTYYGKFVNSINQNELIEENLTEMINFDRSVLGGSIIQGIGNHKLYSSLSNCFVLGEPHDSYSGINAIENELSNVGKRRGGAGIALDNIRPNGSIVHNQASYSSGVVLFAEGYSNKCKQVAQSGRRGALMLSLRIDHPDSLEFIESKQDLTKITGANISVAVPNDFMEAVQRGINGEDDTYLLKFPVNSNLTPFIEDKEYFQNWSENFEYNILIKIDKDPNYNNQPQYIKKIHAKEYWDKLIQCAWKTAEPGILFIGNWEKGGFDYIYPQYRPISTNPCVAGHTLILTNEGEVRIDSKVGEKVKIWNGKKWSEVEPKITGYNQEMLKISVLVRDEKNVSKLVEIECTKYHNWPIIFRGNEILIQTKDLKVEDYLSDFEIPVKIDHSYYLEKYTNCQIADIKQIENAKIVYCFSEPEEHKGIFNGILLGNCSEIPMQPYDACRLLALNLFKLVKKAFTSSSHILWSEIYQFFYRQTIIGDLLIDLELDYIQRIINKIQNDPIDSNLSEERKNYIVELKMTEIKLWQQISKTAKAGRRIGAGFTSLADMMAALGKEYYNPKFLKELFHTKLKAELDATIDMAILFGTFKGFDPKLEKQSLYNQNVISVEFPEQYERMLIYGRRNVSLSTAAPVGTGSLMTQTTSGIEPLFRPWYKRRKKCITDNERVDYIDPNDGQKFTEFYVLHPKFIEWFQIKNSVIYPTIQDAKKYLEMISEKELNEIFSYSPWFGQTANDLNWKQRVEIQSIVQRYTTHAISSTINLPEDVDPKIIGDIYIESWKRGLKGNTVYRDNCRAGILVSTNEKSSISSMIKQVEIAKMKRPRFIPGHYYTLKNKGKIYSIIIGLVENKPYEIFIISDIDNMPQILEENENFILGEIGKDSDEWYNFISDTFTVREISDSEGNEKLLSLTFSALMRNGTPISKIIKIIQKTKPIAGSFTNKLIKILSHYLEEDSIKEKCPECGTELRHENGCVICVNGHSKC